MPKSEIFVVNGLEVTGGVGHWAGVVSWADRPAKVRHANAMPQHGERLHLPNHAQVVQAVQNELHGNRG